MNYGDGGTVKWSPRILNGCREISAKPEEGYVQKFQYVKVEKIGVNVLITIIYQESVDPESFDL